MFNVCQPLLTLLQLNTMMGAGQCRTDTAEHYDGCRTDTPLLQCWLGRCLGNTVGNYCLARRVVTKYGVTTVTHYYVTTTSCYPTHWSRRG